MIGAIVQHLFLLNVIVWVVGGIAFAGICYARMRKVVPDTVGLKVSSAIGGLFWGAIMWAIFQFWAIGFIQNVLQNIVRFILVNK